MMMMMIKAVNKVIHYYATTIDYSSVKEEEEKKNSSLILSLSSPVLSSLCPPAPGGLGEVNNDVNFLLRFINFASCCRLSGRVPRVIISH